MSAPDPDLRQRPRRAAPRDLNRVLLGYLAAALALLAGLPVLVIGWVAASRCSDEGFRCLGWFVYGLLGAAVFAAIMVQVIAWHLRLGGWFGLLAVALVVVPLVLGDGSVAGGTAFLGPGLAAWVSETRPVDPAALNQLEPPRRPISGLRHWGVRLVAVLLVSIFVPLLGRVS